MDWRPGQPLKRLQGLSRQCRRMELTATVAEGMGWGTRDVVCGVGAGLQGQLYASRATPCALCRSPVPWKVTAPGQKGLQTSARAAPTRSPAPGGNVGAHGSLLCGGTWALPGRPGDSVSSAGRSAPGTWRAVGRDRRGSRGGAVEAP